MIKNFTQEIILAVGLLIILLLLVNPGMVLMPNNMQMVLIGVFSLIYLGFVSLVWKERGGDERDTNHRMMADRTAFILGSLVLFVGILSGVFMHEINVWVVLALGAMVLAKILTLIYLRLKN